MSLEIEGSGVHGATIGTSVETDVVARESCTRSGKLTLGVNEGRRPSSAAVFRETGGEGSGGYEAFLGNGEKLISSLDQSALGVD